MWIKNSKYIQYKKQNIIVFSDTIHHWQTGILRLLNINEIKGIEWIEYIFKNISGREWHKMSQQDKYDNIINKSKSYFKVNRKRNLKKLPKGKILTNTEVDHYFTTFRYQKNKFHLFGNNYLKHAVLYDKNLIQVSPIEYEEEYFEGNIESLGYGNYLKQSQWRIEKSRKILSVIKKFSTKANPYIFDIGAGYGFLRSSAEKFGMKHDGLEISKYANKMCKKLFGFNNFEGDIWKYKKKHKFDIITCLDVLEHVKDLDLFLEEVKKHIKKNGLLALRTPNLMSFEFKCFQSKFYSLKIEHLNYFSTLSLAYLLSNHGFSIEYNTTSSHLFSGFKNFSIDCLTTNLEGSDIFMIARYNDGYRVNTDILK